MDIVEEDSIEEDILVAVEDTLVVVEDNLVVVEDILRIARRDTPVAGMLPCCLLNKHQNTT